MRIETVEVHERRLPLIITSPDGDAVGNGMLT